MWVVSSRNFHDSGKGQVAGVFFQNILVVFDCHGTVMIALQQQYASTVLITKSCQCVFMSLHEHDICKSVHAAVIKM